MNIYKDGQLSLLDAIEAKKLGMEQVELNANQQWLEKMLDFVCQAARTRAHFTSDDVFDLADRAGIKHTHDLRAFGPVMMKAAKRGICRKADRAPVPSRRRSLHASPRAIWESLIYVGSALH